MAETFYFFTIIIFLNIFVGLLANRYGYDETLGAVEKYEISEYRRIFNLPEEQNTLDNMFSLFTQMHNLSVRYENYNNIKIKYLKLYFEKKYENKKDKNKLLNMYKSELDSLKTETHSLEQILKPELAAKSISSMETETMKTHQQTNAKKIQIDELKNQYASLKSENEEKERQVQALEKEIDQNTKKILKLKSRQVNSELLQFQMEKLDIQLKSCTSCCQAKSCKAFGKSTDIHMIHVNRQTGAFSVSCNGQVAEAGPGWTVIQRRLDGSENFYRSWEEYKEGFGNLTGEFFIGLEKLHHMTTEEPQELFIHLEDFNNETRFARYSSFLLGGEEGSYKLVSLGEFSGQAGDILTENVDRGFSTFDKGDASNKAISYHGAWWYEDDGSLSNLNGHYIPNGEVILDFRGKGIFWYSDWHDEDYSFKSVQMMIRPRS